MTADSEGGKYRCQSYAEDCGMPGDWIGSPEDSRHIVLAPDPAGRGSNMVSRQGGGAYGINATPGAGLSSS